MSLHGAGHLSTPRTCGTAFGAVKGSSSGRLRSPLGHGGQSPLSARDTGSKREAPGAGVEAGAERHPSSGIS